MTAWEPVKHHVGDRVRVRRSGECPHIALVLHQPEANGQIGTIRADWGPESVPLIPGHRYVVYLDTGLWGALAAVELEPL